MSEALTLFDVPGDDGECQYPQTSAATAYRYGCRCSRCRQAKYMQARTPFCSEEGCDKLRIKGRRYCADHAPPPKADPVQKTGTCDKCGRSHSWYESHLNTNVRIELHDFYRRICSGCRRHYRKTAIDHRLHSDRAIQLVMATHCELCGDRFTVKPNSRTAAFVDHDHRCCPTTRSCGQCVRGIICRKCNDRVGYLDRIIDGEGLQMYLDYIRRSPVPPPPTPTPDKQALWPPHGNP